MPEQPVREEQHYQPAGAESAGAESTRPGHTLDLVRRRFLALLVPLILASGVAFALSSMQEERYEASTSVIFRDSGLDAPVLASISPDREATTQVRLLQLDFLRDRVDARLKQPFEGNLDVIAEAESNLVTIFVTDASPQRAARVANVFAAEYVAVRQEAIRDEIRRQRQAVRAELAALPSGERDQALERRLQRLSISQEAAVGARHVSRAEPPSAASSPNPTRNAMVGGMIGLALGLAFAIALEARDRRLRDPRHIERTLGKPLIGRIPQSRVLAKSKPGDGAALPPLEAEAFRTIRANLRHQLEGQGARSVLVTSAHPQEGKSTVAWNLARVEAASGARVLLVEADLRRPVLAQSLGTDGASGLSELLAGKEKLEHLVQPVGFEGQGSNGDSRDGTLDVLVAGEAPADPAELLASERMQAVLEVMPDKYDLVLVDTPPTPVVADAMPILRLVGGVVVVGRIGMATHSSLLELREQLESFEAPTLGVVVNGDAKPPRSYYSYYSGALRG